MGHAPPPISPPPPPPRLALKTPSFRATGRGKSRIEHPTMSDSEAPSPQKKRLQQREQETMEETLKIGREQQLLYHLQNG